jgi:uncharacterized membrane-anchored protein YhcB (DUF1043 family)
MPSGFTSSQDGNAPIVHEGALPTPNEVEQLRQLGMVLGPNGEIETAKSSVGVKQISEALRTSIPVTRLPSKNLPLKQRIWQVFEDPTSSRVAYGVAAVVVTTIILSTIAFIIQTLPQYVMNTSDSWTIIEVFCVSIFTAEFIIRFFTCPSLLKFIRSPLNIVDFLAILPFYVELALGTSLAGSSSLLRIMRLIRIFRIFKVTRYLPWVRVFINAMTLSLQPLLMLVFVILIAVIVFSSAMYYAERGEWSSVTNMYMRCGDIVDVNTGKLERFCIPSPYQSIPASMWWCIVTLTTVGYGDMFPVTGFGQIIAAFAALSGILVLAIPITIISTNFNTEYADLIKKREEVKSRLSLLKRQFSAKKTGIEAILEEVDEIIKRNTQDFRNSVDSLFTASAENLAEEMQEVIRLAYAKRRMLHLQAISKRAHEPAKAVPDLADLRTLTTPVISTEILAKTSEEEEEGERIRLKK